MTTQEVIELEREHMVGVFERPPFVLERGEGVYLFDSEGRRYLDFVSGVAVNIFGHGHPDILRAISAQAKRLIHCSNLYYSEPGVWLAKLLVENSFADKAFFCNSGTEAMEGAIKFVRKWAHHTFNPPRTRIIAFENSFHGRTLAALSATGQPEFQDGFQPLVPGFKHVPFNKLEAVKGVVDQDTCAIIVEPIQGEGGVYPASSEFLHGLRETCDRNQLLLVFDEVQCGLGRTGALFAYQNYGVEPDVLTIAKSLGGGIPMGAVLLTDRVVEPIKPGNHGTTLGGNPLACAVAETIFGKLIDGEIIAGVKEKGEYFLSLLKELAERYRSIKEVRGLGLMVGVELEFEAKPVVEGCYQRGVLITTAGKKVLRFLPPLIVEKEHIDRLVEALDEVFQGIEDRR